MFDQGFPPLRFHGLKLPDQKSFAFEIRPRSSIFWYGSILLYRFEQWDMFPLINFASKSCFDDFVKFDQDHLLAHQVDISGMLAQNLQNLHGAVP